MYKILRKIADISWVLIFYTAVTMAVLLSAMRITMPYFAKYIPEIEQVASQQLGLVVKVQELDSGWQGFGPALRFDGVVLYNPDSMKPVAKLRYFDVQLDIFSSIKNRKLIPGRLTLEGLQMTFDEKMEGGFQLRHYTQSSDKPVMSALNSLVERFRRVDVKDSQFVLTMLEGAPVKLNLAYFSLSPRRGVYRVDLDIRDEVKQGRLRAMADISGEIGRFDKNIIDGFVRLSNIEYDPRFMPWTLYDIKPQSGLLNLSAWFKWQEGSWQNLIGELALNDVILTNKAYPELKLPFEFYGDIAWQHTGGEFWRLSGDDIKIKVGEHGSPVAAFMLEGGSFTPWDFRLNAIAIDDVFELLTLSNQLKPKQRDALLALDPEGQIHDIQIIATPGETQFKDWRAGFKVKNLHYNAYEGMPQVDNISAEFRVAPQKGQAIIDSQQVFVHTQAILGHPIILNTVTGTLAWEIGDAITLSAKHLRLNHKDVTVDTSFSLNVPEDYAQTTIDLTAQTSGFNQAVAKQFLPSKLPVKASDWIRQSIKKGHVLGLQTVIKGPVKKFPFKDKSGEFEMRFDVDSVDLAYHPQWPALHNLSGELVIESDRMQAIVDSGIIYNSTIEKAKIEMPFTPIPEPLILHISGIATGEGNDGERFLRNSPLWEKLGQAFELIDINGPARLDLKADVPLRQNKEYFKVDGKAVLAGGEVSIDKWDMVFSEANGKLHFTEKSIEMENATATLMGKPVTMQAKTTHRNNESRVKWTLDTRFDLSTINHFVKNDFWYYLQGESDVQASFNVFMPKREEPLKITFQSDLIGMAVNMPEPLGKPMEDAAPSSLTLWSEQPQTLNVAFDYGDIVEGDLFFTEHQNALAFNNAEIYFGGDKSDALTPAPGVQVSGHMRSLDFSQWNTFWQDHQNQFPPDASKPPLDIRLANLQVDDLHYKNWGLHYATVSANKTLDYWNLEITSDEMAGLVQYPHSFEGLPLKLDLTRCEWVKSTDTSTTQKLTPAQVIPIDFRCGSFNYQDRDLGEVQLGIQPVPGGVNFDPIKVTSDIDSLTATATWMADDAGEVSSITGMVDSENVGQSLRSWGLKTDIRDAKGEISFDLTWPGAPTKINMAGLEGEMDISLRNGRFVEVNPGFGRILGLLSVQSLQRRLRLDFTDVFKEGFSFDTFDSSVRIAGGNAYTEEAFMKAPAANVTISGRAGLVDRDLDFDMYVHAVMDSTVPAAAVAIANPIAGAAVWLADKMFNPFENVGRYYYHITGTWDDPQFQDMKKAGEPAIPPVPVEDLTDSEPE